MSTFRPVTIYKPFLTRTMKFKWIVLTGVLCWLFSLLFAFLPWIQLKSGYFVSEVWFPSISSELTQFPNMISSPQPIKFLAQIPLFSHGSKSGRPFHTSSNAMK